MSKPNSDRSENPIVPKEKTSGTNGINRILMSVHPISVHSENTRNRREQTGMIDLSTKPKQGMFFHSFDADGEVEHQGHLLALSAKGYGRAQLFEWFWGEPSKVIEVTPDYLRNCVFYASATAMNAAYAQWEASHD